MLDLYKIPRDKLSDLILELKDAIDKYGDLEYELTAAYGAEGDIMEIVKSEEEENLVYLVTNIMTG